MATPPARRDDRPSPATFARRRLTVLLVLVGLVALLLTLAFRGDGGSPTLEGPIGAIREDPNTEPFEGMGVWVDIHDQPSWDDPTGAAATMAARGVRTLYLQTSNDERPGPIVHETALPAMVEAAHDRGIQVVAWYLPGFVDPDEDLARSIAAIEYRTPRGDAFDGFALDIESAAQEDIALRTERLVDVSAALREAAGEEYPLGAITPLPIWLEEDPGYWPGFPYGPIATTYDAILPMTYFTWRVDGREAVTEFTERNTAVVRARVGNRDVPIHVIGGLARDAKDPETRGFVDAVRTSDVLGASYYSLPAVTERQWELLARIPDRAPPG